MKKNIMIVIFLLFVSTVALASETHYLARSPHALLMGDAFTARADDDYTLFYNPAALGRTNGMSLTPINPQLGITNALDDLERFEKFPNNDAVAISNRLMGFPVYTQLGAAPSLKFGPIGISLFANTKMSAVLHNSTHPTLDLDYRYDRGFIMGYAYSFGSATHKGRSKKKGTAGTRTSIGISVKNINRQGITDSLDLFGTELLNAVSDTKNDSLQKVLDSLGYSRGKAWGADLGFEHSLVKGPSELTFGLSVMDVGDTRFKKISGTGEIPKQEMMVNTGVTWRQKVMLADYSISLDARDLNDYMPLARRMHLGVDLGLAIVRIMAGYSEGYVSYGLGLNLWPIKIMAGFYGVELGNKFREEEGKRAVIYISLLDFSFDA